MMATWYAGVITLVGAIAVILIAVWLVSGSEPAESAESVTPRLYMARGGYLAILLVVLVIMLMVTLPNLPYAASASSAPEHVVPVIARKWSWSIGPVQDRSGKAIGDASELVLPVGESLEFQVSSEDVNHGFGIYDEGGRLIAQTQAMPGYVNRLAHTFTQPGTYHVLCMEYCGLVHHAMVTTIKVE